MTGAARSLGVLAALLAGKAAVGSELEAYRVAYEAPEGCPSEAFFVHEVRARSENLRLAAPDELARVLRATVTAAGTGSTGTLEIVTVGGDRVRREVAADSCEEVVPALALVTALALDALARGEASPVAVDAKPAPALEPRPSQAPEPAPSPPTAPTPARRATARVELGALAVVATAVAPRAVIGLDAYVGVRSSDARGPGIRVAAALRRSRVVEVAERQARLELWAARAEACPFALEISGPLRMVPCGALEVGRLEGEGIAGGEVARARASSALWLAAGARARLEVPIERVLLVQLGGGLAATFARERFVFRDPEVVFHDVPAIAADGFAGLGMSF